MAHPPNVPIARTLKLSRPIHDADKEILELAFKEPDGELLEEVDRAGGREGLAMLKRVSYMTNVGFEALRRAHFRDVRRAGLIVQELMQDGEEDDDAFVSGHSPGGA